MFILLEIQTENQSTALLPALTYSDRNQAESAFYQKLSYAAISEVDIHTVILLDEHGNTIKREFYEHITEAE